MKITLDISKLVEEGKLTREEAGKLTAPGPCNDPAPREKQRSRTQYLTAAGIFAVIRRVVARLPIRILLHLCWGTSQLQQLRRCRSLAVPMRVVHSFRDRCCS